jgi:hypothetical protein
MQILKSLVKMFATLKVNFVGMLKTGVDVMITFFCDFCQFTAKKLSFFSITNVVITIFEKTSSDLG